MTMINAGKCFVFILLISGCMKKDLPPPKQAPDMPSPPEVVENLTVELTLDKPSYKRTGSVGMTLTITNPSRESFRTSLRSAQTYDFIVTKDGREIWRWSFDRMFAQALRDLEVKPGKMLSYQETWDQRDNARHVVSRGRYEMAGILKTIPEVVSSLVLFELADE